MSLRRVMVDAVVRGASALGLPALVESLTPADLTILCYHSIVDGPIPEQLARRGLHLPVESFARQMSFLAARSEILPLAEAVSRLDRKARGRRPGVVITFDDGYRNNLTLAAPILERLGIPASVFLVSRLLDAPRPFWWDELSLLMAGAGDRTLVFPSIGTVPLGEPRAKANLAGSLRQRLTIALPDEREALLEPLRDAQRRPIPSSLLDLLRPLGTAEARAFPSQVRFGNHTATHRVLSGIGDDPIRWELEAGRRELSEALGDRFDANVVCYPRGIASPQALDAARQLGIPIGLGLKASGWISRARPSSPRLTLPRVVVGGSFAPSRFRLAAAGITFS